jgi:hypothetical protein
MGGSISVTEGAGAAFDFLARSWSRAAGALALAGLLGAAAGLAFQDRNLARAWLLSAAYFVAVIMAQGALLRFAYAGRRPADRTLPPGFGGFQWGAVEWRLLGVSLLRALLFGLLGALFLTVVAALYVGLAASEARAGFAAAAHAGWRPSLDSVGWTVVGAVGLAGAAGLSWVGSRLYLAFAATVAVGRVQLLSTWTLTRGRAWRILGAVILVWLPGLGLALAARIGQRLLTPGSGGEARMVVAASNLFVGLGHAFLTLPLSVGLMIYLYDRLGPENAGVS